VDSAHLIPLLSPVNLLLVTLTLRTARSGLNLHQRADPGRAAASTTKPRLPPILIKTVVDYGFGNIRDGWSTAAGMILFAVFAVVALVCVPG